MRAGAIVPAAVVSIGRNRGRCSAPSSTALYPETVACDESASIDCARVVRGIDSIANPSTPRCRESLDALLVGQRRQERDEQLAGAELRLLLLRRRRDLHDRVDAVPGVVDELGARLGIGRIGKAGSVARAALDEHGRAVEPRDRIRDQRNPLLTLRCLSGDSDPHLRARRYRKVPA